MVFRDEMRGVKLSQGSCLGWFGNDAARPKDHLPSGLR